MATEKQLIDFEKAKKSVMQILAGKVTTVTAVKVAVAMQDASVDAVEVVHGKWELRNVTSGMNGRYWCCSACGCIRSYWEYKAEDNYCPNCGAKMDGKENQ